jgi:hypothetical protein
MGHLPVAFYVACCEYGHYIYDEVEIDITFEDLGDLIGGSENNPNGVEVLRFIQLNQSYPCLVACKNSITQAIRILCSNLQHAYPNITERCATIGWEGEDPETSERVVFKFRDDGPGINFQGKTPVERYQEIFRDKSSENKLGYLKTIMEIHNGRVEVVTSTHTEQAYSTTDGIIPLSNLKETDGRFLPNEAQKGTCFRLVLEPFTHHLLRFRTAGEPEGDRFGL